MKSWLDGKGNDNDDNVAIASLIFLIYFESRDRATSFCCGWIFFSGFFCSANFFISLLFEWNFSLVRTDQSQMKGKNQLKIS